MGLKYLDIEQGSIWLIFLSMMVLINLFDFGLSPTTIRNVSYVIGGAQSLAKNGINTASHNKDISYP
ncbi:TPA: O-unit flippase-like protein, partial [Citrobacter freundii]